MKYVILVDMSAGNESVGEMWQESYIFDGETSLDDVMEKVERSLPRQDREYSRKRITITKPHPEDQTDD